MSAQANGGDPATKKNQFKCIVPGCRSSTSTNIAKLHSFPWRDMPRANKWIVAVGCLQYLGAPPKALLRLRVCDLHFDRKLKRGKNMKLWDHTAVPTLRLGPAGAAGAAREEPAGAAGGAPATVRLPGELARFLILREKLRERNTARRGYDRDFAALALQLRLACPEAYRVLWRSLRLPPPALLARVDLGVGTRLDGELLRCFETKLGRLPPRERECVLCLDEVELTGKLFYAIDKDELVGLEEVEGELGGRPAARALLLAARGLRAGWTQPLGYFLLAEHAPAARLAAPLRRLVVHALCGRARAPVRAVLAALGPTFAELAAALGVSVESPFVLDAAPRRRVCFLHDPEQLLLTLRDTLIAYDVRYREPGGAARTASWRHVQRLQREDAARARRLLPELTRARVWPSPRESLREGHAAAVFSRRVAAQLEAAPGAAGTARLLRLAADARLALRAPRPRGLARLAGAAAALTAALADMRVVSPDGAEHDAEVFVRSLRVTLAGALHLLAEAEGPERDAPLRLARCGLRPLRRFIERAEGERGRADPRELRRRFRRWAMRRLLEPAPAPAAPDDLAELLRHAEGALGAGAAGARAARALALGPLRHRPAARARSAAGVARALLHEARRAHDCAALAGWARGGAGARLVRALDGAMCRALSSRGPNAPGARSLAAVAGCLAARAPCACFPRDTFARLFVRSRLRAALLACNAGGRWPGR